MISRKIKRFYSRLKNKASLKSAKIFAKKAKSHLDSGMRKMGNEARETKEMAQTFYTLLEHKLNLKERSDPPTHKEVKEAVEQLKDVGRVSFFAAMVILPGGVVSLIGLEILAAKYGIKNFTFIPSAFRKNADWHYPDDYEQEHKEDPIALPESS